NRVLVAFGEHDGTGVTGGVMTAAEAQQMANTHSSPVWDEVVTELTALEASAQSTPPPPPPSEVNITAAVDGTEGTSVSFTLTATPAPSADLPVSVTVSVVGDYGVTAGSQTLTIPTSGSTTFTVATTDDDADEPDGSVTLTVNAGSDYTVGALSSETATVADDDPVQEQPQMPVVTITAGSGVTEGGSVEFTVSASSVPAADLDVTVTVTAVGDYGVTADTRTVTIPTSGSAILTVATAGDDADEPDGSVTATLVDGADYDLGTPNTVTVTVVDDDPSPPLPPDTDEPDQPDDAVLTACADRPTLLISSPEASRSDATVDFEVSLSCIPSGSPMILLTPVRDGNIGENMFVALSSEQTSATVTVTIGSEDQLGLALAWNTGLANRKAQGDVTYTD
ncbi:MAG: hypothetical protein OXI96_10035, partial [Acidimicrobiaceae bacterium]|nr:hypothetical protein [Acidimicrobiaceae bacterium]